jgi:hypothetical protein
MQIDKIISFNTGRHYSEQGQRIAAAVAPSGVVIMVDIDRGIDYALPGAALERKDIMRAYDYDKGINANISHFNNDGALRKEFMDQLRDHALLASPGCILPK